MPTLRYDDLDPAQVGRREALCALGNGVFVTRGASAWASADGTHYPATYLAGGYDRATSEVAGRELENEDLVNLVNWLPLTFRVVPADADPDAPRWFDLADAEILGYRQDLDMDRGVLHLAVQARLPDGHVVRVDEERLVHIVHPHLAAQRMTISLEPRPGGDGAPVVLEVRAMIDGDVENRGVARYAELTSRHVEVLDTDGRAEAGGARIWLRSRTRSSRLEVAVGATVEVHGGGPGDVTIDAAPQQVAATTARTIDPGAAALRVDKVVALHTSRDAAGYEPVTDVHRTLDSAGTYDELLASHEQGWAALWARSKLEVDIRPEADGATETVLALHRFHIHQTYSDHSTDRDVGVPARGWHGEAYRGHIFWDELFVLPLLDYQFPERSRAAIGYRYRRLPEARRAAAAAGCRGAMFPWQSGASGREENPTWHLNPRSGRWNPDVTYLQRHIGLAVAYNVWHHWKVTANAEFLHEEGAELVLSVADFFADLATWDADRERYVIRNVIGPDEYHTGYPDAAEPGIDNNAYTNVMTAWLLGRALDIVELVAGTHGDVLLRRLDIDDDRLEHWRAVATQLHVPFLDGHGGPAILEQFEGYGRLQELDWEGYRQRYGDISRLDRILEAEGDSPNRYQASKQADVAMLFFLLSAEELTDVLGGLGYRFTAEDIPANVDHYLKRTSHGSTLSAVVHSWVAARSDREASWACFQRALYSDVDDIQDGTTPEGIHLGAMAGTVDLAQHAYSGLHVDGDTVRLNPRLPDQITSLRFSMQFRIRWTLDIDVTDGTLTVTCRGPEGHPVHIAVKGESIDLFPGRTHVFDLVELKEG